MKKSILVVLMITGLFSACKRDWDNPYDSPGNWQAKNAFEGVQRYSASSFVIGNNAYVGLGYNSDMEGPAEQYLRDWWIYSPGEDRWDMIPYIPGAGRTGAVAFSLGGKGYVGTGFDGTNYLKDFWEYDPQKNLWIRKDDFPGKIRSNAVSFTLSEYAYVGTGIGLYDDTDLAAFVDFYRFNPDAEPGNQWKKVSSIGGDKRFGAIAFTHENKAYVCTGVNNTTIQNDLWEYDPNTNAWMKKNNLNENNNWLNIPADGSSFVMDGKAYVLLGGNSDKLLKEVWLYNFEQDTWIKKADFEGAARAGAVAFTVGDRTFVGLGISETGFLDDIWEYKPGEKYNDQD